MPNIERVRKITISLPGHLVGLADEEAARRALQFRLALG
jgi:hypothetical protein